MKRVWWVSLRVWPVAISRMTISEYPRRQRRSGTYSSSTMRPFTTEVRLEVTTEGAMRNSFSSRPSGWMPHHLQREGVEAGLLRQHAAIGFEDRLIIAGEDALGRLVEDAGLAELDGFGLGLP